MAKDYDDTRSADTREKKGLPLSPKQLVGLVLLLVVAIFCAQNTGDTTIKLFGGETESPLWVWLLGVLALGVLIGILLPVGRKKD